MRQSLILQTLHRFTYVTAHSPTLSSILLRHRSFYNPSVASPTSHALHLRHLASRPWLAVWGDCKNACTEACTKQRGGSVLVTAVQTRDRLSILGITYHCPQHQCLAERKSVSLISFLNVVFKYNSTNLKINCEQLHLTLNTTNSKYRSFQEIDIIPNGYNSALLTMYEG